MQTTKLHWTRPAVTRLGASVDTLDRLSSEDGRALLAAMQRKLDDYGLLTPACIKLKRMAFDHVANGNIDAALEHANMAIEAAVENRSGKGRRVIPLDAERHPKV